MLWGRNVYKTYYVSFQMIESEKTKKKDFVEIKYTGYTNGQIFDSNIEEDLKKINPDDKPLKIIIAVGEKMLVQGLDNALEGKELDKEYEVEVGPKEGFGERDRNLVKTIPLKVFVEKQLNPKPGMVFVFDNQIAKVITISGARVITDFNNPLAGKVLKYKFKIVRRIDDDKEKSKSFFEYFFRFVPDFEVKDSVVIKGRKELEFVVNAFINAYKEKFKEVVGKDLKFQLEEKVEDNEKKEEKQI